VVTFDDGSVGTVSATRYNGAGHDVRLELQGSAGSVMVGMDEQMAMSSAEPGVGFPAGPPHRTFAERFHTAYRAEMAAFVELVLGEAAEPVHAGGRRRSVHGGRCRPGVAAVRGAGAGRAPDGGLTREERGLAAAGPEAFGQLRAAAPCNIFRNDKAPPSGLWPAGGASVVHPPGLEPGTH
jgi:hypothetical protein